MLEINRQKDDSGFFRLKLSGDVTIQEAPTLRQELIAALQEENAICLHLAGVEEMDLTCFQLFCAAHQTALAERKRFIIDEDMPNQLSELVKSSGFERGRGCATNPNPSSCIWAKEISP